MKFREFREKERREREREDRKIQIIERERENLIIPFPDDIGSL